MYLLLCLVMIAKLTSSYLCLMRHHDVLYMISVNEILCMWRTSHKEFVHDNCWRGRNYWGRNLDNWTKEGNELKFTNEKGWFFEVEDDQSNSVLVLHVLAYFCPVFDMISMVLVFFLNILPFKGAWKNL